MIPGWIRAGAWSFRGVGLALEFERTHDQATIDEAIDLMRGAVRATPSSARSAAVRHLNLCSALHARFQARGDANDIEEAVAAGMAAVAAATRTRHWAAATSALGVALRARSILTGRPDDLSAAVTALRQAVAAWPPRDPRRHLVVSNLGVALLVRFERTGTAADLDDAIAAFRTADGITSAPAVMRAATRANLTAALRVRYEHRGDLDDLDEAVSAGTAAATALPDSHPQRIQVLGNLSNALLVRFGETGTPADLANAIGYIYQAAARLRPGHIDYTSMLSNLSIALGRRFQLTGDPADLDAAAVAARAAVEAVPGDLPQRARHLLGLGTVLLHRYEARNDPADLDEAATTLGDASRGLLGDPSRAMALFNLGSLLRHRWTRDGREADAHAAGSAWRAAMSERAAETGLRIGAGVAMGELAAQRGKWKEAADGLAAATALLPLLAWRGVGRRSQEELLARRGGLAAEAGACTTAAGSPDQAIELLELGRGVLWSQLIESRTSLTGLAAHAPDLATRLEAVRTALDRPSSVA